MDIRETITKTLKTILLGIVVYIFGGTFIHMLVEMEVKPVAQVTQSMNGVSVRQTGVVTIDKWICYNSNAQLPVPPQPGVPFRIEPAKFCPTRIEFAQDTHPDLLLCMTTETGQSCKKISEVFVR